MTLDFNRNDPPRRVILLRHGQTSWNAEGRWQGREDVPLDATGLGQAERAAAVLVRDTTITRLVTSPARRASQTAAVVKGAFDLAGRPVIRSQDRRLLEVDVGLWTGLTHDEVEARYPGEFAAIAAGDDVRYGGHGERLSEASWRAQQAVIEAVGAASPGETVVVVMHGAVLRGVVAALCGLPMELFKRSFASMQNCHWTTMTHHGGRWIVESWNVSS